MIGGRGKGLTAFVLRSLKADDAKQLRTDSN